MNMVYNVYLLFTYIFMYTGCSNGNHHSFSVFVSLLVIDCINDHTC